MSFATGQVETEVDIADFEFRHREALELLSTGEAEDLDAAVKQLKRLAVEGHARSQYFLAQLYLEGYGLAQNLEQGKRWLQRAAEGGNPIAALQWAEFLFGEIDEEEGASYGQIVDLLQSVVSPEAQSQVSPEDFGLFRRSKSRASYLLGVLYLNGWGVAEDKNRSLELMLDASRTGDKDATMTLAIAYAKGEDVEKDVTRSKEFFELYDLQSIDEVNRSMESYFAGSEDAGDRQNLLETSRQFSDVVSEMVTATQLAFALEVLDEQSEDYDPEFAATLLSMAAENGNEEARLRLGVLYHRGIGVERDLGIAASHFERGAEEDWVLSLYNLAAMIGAGEAKAPEGASVSTLLQRAADQGLYVAELALDESPKLAPLSPEEARDLCLEAAERSDGRALYSLGLRKSVGWLVEVETDLSKVLELYVKSSNQGFKRAQHLVGIMRMSGEGVPFDPVGGFELVRNAAYQGLPEAVFTLGQCYLSGMGVEANVHKAYEHFERAAALGYQNAYNRLAAFHFTGILVPKNEYKAAELYLKAAGADDPEAAQNLGNCYLQGVGVSMSTKEGIRWIAKAAELGNLAACYQLADIYRANLLVDSDEVEVAFWMEKAAELGDKTAMRETAFNYYLGRGHPKNKGKAAHWLDLYMSHPAPVAGGSLYYPGEYEPIEVVESFDPGDYAAMLLQADLYSELNWTGTDRKEARRILERLIAKDSMAAKLRFCRLCLEEESKGRDAKKALSYLRKIYEQNRDSAYEGLRTYAAQSARLLSQYYGKGYGLSVSESQSEKWLENSALLGDLDSQRELGKLLSEKGSARGAGIAWFLKAARAGDTFSRLTIARLNLDSPIAAIEKDVIVEWLKRLVDDGSGEARLLLRKYGVRYKEQDRRAVDPDPEEPEFDPWAPVGAA
ncbi:tetratricopeptide repeat protein [Pelagicoccus enzymogenes]|uniref:tetratricopeptide repeat protein n=1 Tax=Pelagicoccus enzymogenes TaxID=2773457 RepID=UPI001786B320|nr:tetratricopeptide repeat protein [Pelagicoccus enzymogenes]